MPTVAHSRLEQFKNHLYDIEWELLYAQKSWVLFENSTMLFSDGQEPFLDLVTECGITEPFEHIQTIALHNVVATLCRIYDEPGADRICLAEALNLLQLGFDGACQAELTELTKKREEIFRNDAFQELRKFRNSEIGHKLKISAPCTYKYLPKIIIDTSDLLGEMFSLAGLNRWCGQPTASGIERRANKFWSLLESAMNHESSGRR